MGGSTGGFGVTVLFRICEGGPMVYVWHAGGVEDIT